MAEYRSGIEWDDGEWNNVDESLPVPQQKIAIRFSDCCVNGIMTGVVASIVNDEDDWPSPNVVFVDGSSFNGNFDWKVMDQC